MDTLQKIMSLLSGGISFLGIVLIVWGLVNLGLVLREGSGGGGGSLTSAISCIVGGAVVFAAGMIFGGLDIGWVETS